MDSDSTMQIIMLLLLVCTSGFFSAAEASLLSVNKVRLMNLYDDGNKKAGMVLAMLDEQDKVLSTILVGNNVANIAASAIATNIAITLWGSAGVGLATGFMTLLILIVGEVVPKNIATGMANSFSMKIISLLRILMLVLTPLIWVLTTISNLAKKISKSEEEDPIITEDELKILVNAGQEEGFLDESEKDMINSIFEFDETTVKEIMVPRIDMVALDGEDVMAKALEVILKEGHSRIPVYENSIDNIIGILYAKDLLKNMDKNFSEFKIKNIVRNAYYIPENKYINDLLTEMRQKKVHMAIILDEYGGTEGLITIEDLIEEIVGDIQDEYDSEKELIKISKDSNGTFVICDARALIYDVLEALDVELSEETESDTIGGLVFEHLGGVPKLGDEATFDVLQMKVCGVDGHRVSEVEVRAIKKEEVEEDDWLSRKLKEKEREKDNNED